MDVKHHVYLLVIISITHKANDSNQTHQHRQRHIILYYTFQQLAVRTILYCIIPSSNLLSEPAIKHTNIGSGILYCIIPSSNLLSEPYYIVLYLPATCCQNQQSNTPTSAAAYYIVLYLPATCCQNGILYCIIPSSNLLSEPYYIVLYLPATCCQNQQSRRWMSGTQREAKRVQKSVPLRQGAQIASFSSSVHVSGLLTHVPATGDPHTLT